MFAGSKLKRYNPAAEGHTCPSVITLYDRPGGSFWDWWLGVVQESEHHCPGAGRGVVGLPLVAADQFLLVGDELGGLLPGERERGAPTDPGPAPPLAHGPARGTEPLEALQGVRPARWPQSGHLRLRLDAEALAGDPRRLRRGLPPPFPALPAAGDLAHAIALGQQPQVIA